MATVVEQFAALGVVEPARLVANSKEHTVVHVGVNGVAGPNVNYQEMVWIPIFVHARHKLASCAHRRADEIDMRLHQ